MTELLEMDEGGQALISEEFLSGDAELTEDDLGPYLNHTGIKVDLTHLDTKVDEILEEFEQGDAKIDRELASTVHRTLDLTRREAAIAGIWHYMTVLEYPELVRHRWGHVSNVREKFLEGGEDIYSNAIHRLWWIAEITRDGDDYSRTRAIFEMQELANDISDRWFARHQPITYACIDVLQKSEIEDLEPSNSAIVSKTTTRLREKLTVVCAEGLDYPKAVELVTQIRDDVVGDL
jgi:hypothetical protein